MSGMAQRILLQLSLKPDHAQGLAQGNIRRHTQTQQEELSSNLAPLCPVQAPGKTPPTSIGTYYWSTAVWRAGWFPPWQEHCPSDWGSLRKGPQCWRDLGGPHSCIIMTRYGTSALPWSYYRSSLTVTLCGSFLPSSPTAVLHSRQATGRSADYVDSKIGFPRA